MVGALFFSRFDKYSPFDFIALCSDASAVAVEQVYFKRSYSDTLHNISRNKLATVF